MDFQLLIFRPETQKNLQAERLIDQDRRYIVRTVSTMLLSSISRPTIDDCANPAKALVAKYPFLADATEDGRTSHVNYFLIFMVFFFSVCLDEVYCSEVLKC